MNELMVSFIYFHEIDEKMKGCFCYSEMNKKRTKKCDN